MQPEEKPSISLEYRRDVDGLRALAVIGVVLFHIFPGTLPGGFIGVDVFFVISGFLISRLVWDDIDRGKFSVGSFYSRRVRRIFPALAVTLAAVLVAGPFLLFREELAELCKHVFAGAFFSSNFVLWSESGYFDTASERKPLLHLWSLSIEEQFYLVWPLLLFALSRARLSFLSVASLFGLLSLLLSVSLSTTDAAAAFYNPLGRFWELTLGAVAGWLVRRHGSLPIRVSVAAAPLAIVGILAGFWLLSESCPFPGWWALVPTCSTALALSCNSAAPASRRILGSEALVSIGKISYPLYLWHWPIWSFVFIRLHGNVPLVARVGVLAASFLLATATFWLLERPLRRRQAHGRLVAALVATVFALGGVGLLGWKWQGFPAREAALVDAPYLNGAALSLERWLQSVRAHSCHQQEPGEVEFPAECHEERRPALVLWGDSHAAALYPGLRELQKTREFGLTQWTRAACPPFPEANSSIGNCDQVNRQTIGKIAKLQPEVLVVHAAWIHQNYPNTSDSILANTAKQLDELQQLLPRTKLVVIGLMPYWGRPLPEIIKEHIDTNHSRPPLYMPRTEDDALRQRQALDDELRRICAKRGIAFISPESVMCDKNSCITRLEDESPDGLFGFDQGHLTSAGARFFVGQVADQLLP